MRRGQPHLRVVAGANEPGLGRRPSDPPCETCGQRIDSIAFFRNEVTRLRAALRKSSSQQERILFAIGVYRKAWDAVTKGEQDGILQLASGFENEADYLE